MQYSIATSRETIIAADGTGRIQLGPRKVGERWSISNVTTTSDSNTEEYTPKLDVTRNGHERIGGSWNANFDSADAGTELRQNEFIRCDLSGGEPGARWVISIDGNGYAV